MRGIIREMEPNGNDVTLTDLEAGLEHLKRGTPRYCDAMLIVVEPYWRSIETGIRVADMTRELEIPVVGFVGNKIRDEQDAGMIEDVARDRAPLLALVPWDERLVAADRAGRSVLDFDPEAPSVAAVAQLLDRLEAIKVG